MHRFTGQLQYTTDNSGRRGQTVRVEFGAQFFPGLFSLRIDDANAGTSHVLTNRRFNFQARDSPVDLLARGRWRSEWFDRFTGPVFLLCPRITGVPRELRVTVICSWASAFAVVEYQLDDTFYQFSCRPPRGTNVWTRVPERSFPEEDENPPENEPGQDSRFPPPDDEPTSSALE